MIDLQKGEYNPDKIAAEPQHAYLFERIREVVIPNGQSCWRPVVRPVSR